MYIIDNTFIAIIYCNIYTFTGNIKNQTSIKKILSSTLYITDNSEQPW